MSSHSPPLADFADDEPVVAELAADVEGEAIPTATLVALPVDELQVPEPRPRGEPVPRPGFFGFLTLGVEWTFGVAALFLGLSVLASVPVGQFLVLGYLLEVSGRVARTGRLRDGFIGVRPAAKLGGIALAGFVLWLPLYFISLQAEAAQIIDPNGRVARAWQVALTILATAFALHVGAALVRGGRVRSFLNPLAVPMVVLRAFRGGLFADARDRLWSAVAAMRVPYYFWLGVRGFVGSFVWLAIPVLLLGRGHRYPLVGFVGGLMLAAVVLYVPFLQVRFARVNRFRAFAEPLAVRQVFRREPLAFAFALWVHLLFAIPLYLLKIEVIPRDLVFLEGLMFLLFIFPARLLGGWAYSRGARRPKPRFWLFRWLGRVAVLPVVAAYVFVVFLSQHLGWAGVGSLYEQHAFLLPVPFVAWR